MTLVLTGVRAQTPPWVGDPTSETFNIIIADTTDFQITGYSAEAGDYISVLYDSAGLLKVSSTVRYTGNSDTLVAYGDTGSDNGFEDGEIFTFYIWDSSANCQIYAITPTYLGGEQSFADGGEATVDNFMGTVNGFFYSHNYFCQSYSGAGTDPEPFKIGYFVDDTVFFSSAPGLDIDSASGAINTLNSQPGDYLITVSASPSCLLNDTLNISIGDGFNDSLPNNLSEGLLCSEQTIDFLLDSAYFSNGLEPYSINIMDTEAMSSINGNNPWVNDLGLGTYPVFITDALGCTDTLSLSVAHLENCDHPIITPELNDEFSTYYIDCAGELTIYNRYGQLVKSFLGPVSWDATDKNGELVPTGEYFIFCNEEKKEQVTVIR